jgi:hypothetical protein
MNDHQEEPKIVVDDDWKSKVQAEKEAAQQPPERAPEPAPEAPHKPARGRPASEIPPASFSVLISTLAAQAMTAMGKVPDPLSGHPVVRPDLAQHCIDTLDMLEEKTKGNLTTQESAILTGILYELRMMYVTIRANPPEQKSEAPAAN